MKFKNVLTSRASIKKKKEYDLQFDDSDIAKAIEATWEKPYLFRDKNKMIWCGYVIRKKLQMQMMHSFDIFEKSDD